MKKEKKPWKDDILETFDFIGGKGHYSEIYTALVEIRGKENLNKFWKKAVQNFIETHSSDSNAYSGKQDLFYSVEGKGSGVWGLRNYKSNNRTSVKEDEELDEEIYEEIMFDEGNEYFAIHLKHERNPKLIKLAKEKFKSNNNGRIFCEICEFDFENEYGEIGRNFIEAHHQIPISQLPPNSKTKVSDLLMVCSNCHRMLHRMLQMEKI